MGGSNPSFGPDPLLGEDGHRLSEFGLLFLIRETCEFAVGRQSHHPPVVVHVHMLVAMQCYDVSHFLPSPYSVPEIRSRRVAHEIGIAIVRNNCENGPYIVHYKFALYSFPPRPVHGGADVIEAE